MPHIHLRIPRGAIPADAHQPLIQRLTDIAAAAEQIPPHPRHRRMCWLTIEETEPDSWFCGAQPASHQCLPCTITLLCPAGVLDASAVQHYAQATHQALQEAVAQSSAGLPLATSICIQPVPDGQWAVNGQVWTLADFAGAAGYAHLQHLQ